MLGAGFPVLFICDHWGGGSPTGSWNKVDFVDVLNGGVKPASFLLDLLFYTVLIWGAVFLAVVLLRRGSAVRGTYSWAAWVSIGYILGLLTGYLIFHPNALGLERLPVRTPTPVMPTPLGFAPTRPPPNSTGPVDAEKGMRRQADIRSSSKVEFGGSRSSPQGGGGRATE
jgi:hypothetical protein